MNAVVWIIFVIAALLEVGGDAVIRSGLRGRGFIWILIGSLTLACYGLLVNSVKWEFSRLIGVYVGFFALISVLFGRLVLGEAVSISTWCGLALIILGGLMIQFAK